jgi:hypothetical protein
MQLLFKFQVLAVVVVVVSIAAMLLQQPHLQWQILVFLSQVVYQPDLLLDLLKANKKNDKSNAFLCQ